MAEHNKAYEFIDITQNPPSQTILSQLPKLAGIEINKLFNTSGEVYKEMKLKDKLKGMSDKEKFSLLAKNGRLIKRPVIISGTKATVGFNEDVFNKVWN